MSLSGETVLVTGATGFLGGALAIRLAGEGTRVRALARSLEKGDFLRRSEGVSVVQGDILDPARMRDVVQGCTHVFHAAAALKGGLKLQRRVNVEGTRNVMEAAAEAGVRRAVHVSTISVYGHAYAADIVEDMGPVRGHYAYGMTKAEAEGVVRDVGNTRGMSYSIVRPGMIYGPRSHHHTAKVFRQAKRKVVLVVGSKRGSVPMVYVDDVVDLCITVATHPAAGGEVFNATYDPSPSWDEVIGGHARLAGHEGWIGFPKLAKRVMAHMAAALSPPHSIYKEAPAMVDFYDRTLNFKMTKARDLLGWEPRVDLEAGLRECAVWLREEGLLS